MNILPINNVISTNNQASTNMQTTGFKGVKVNAVAKELGDHLPQADMGVTRIWRKLFKAIQEEQNLQVLDRQIFNFIKEHPDYFPDLYITCTSLEDIGRNVNIIAKDETGALLVAGSDNDGQYLQINTDRGYRKFGITYRDRNGMRYPFYKVEGAYLDYFNNGKLRTSRTIALGGESTVHYDEKGKSTVYSNVKGFFDDMLNTFDKIFK